MYVYPCRIKVFESIRFKQTGNCLLKKVKANLFFTFFINRNKLSFDFISSQLI